jgi:hypothetical protein
MAKEKRETFVATFRRLYGRDPVKSDVGRILKGLGIEPDAEGYYHRHQFAAAAKSLGLSGVFSK